jgi:hypothetical protein
MQDSESDQLGKALPSHAGRVAFETVLLNPKLKLLDQVRKVLWLAAAAG